MFNTEAFSHLSIKQKLHWYNRANQLREANQPASQLEAQELSACIWAGEIMLSQYQDNPPHSFGELDAMLELHRWLISLKHEWIDREFKKSYIPSYVIPGNYPHAQEAR